MWSTNAPGGPTRTAYPSCSVTWKYDSGAHSPFFSWPSEPWNGPGASGFDGSHGPTAGSTSNWPGALSLAPVGLPVTGSRPSALRTFGSLQSTSVLRVGAARGVPCVVCTSPGCSPRVASSMMTEGSGAGGAGGAVFAKSNISVVPRPEAT